MGWIIGVACFWMYMAYRSYSVGNVRMSILYVALGAASAALRIIQLKRRTQAARAPSEPPN